jgi:hypothetical protein
MSALLSGVRGSPWPVCGVAISVDKRSLPPTCVSGRHPMVIVTTGALRALDAGQLDAVLAHARAHLAGLHHRLLGPAEQPGPVHRQLCEPSPPRSRWPRCCWPWHRPRRRWRLDEFLLPSWPARQGHHDAGVTAGRLPASRRPFCNPNGRHEPRRPRASEQSATPSSCSHSALLPPTPA